MGENKILLPLSNYHVNKTAANVLEGTYSRGGYTANHGLGFLRYSQKC